MIKAFIPANKNILNSINITTVTDIIIFIILYIIIF